MSVPSRIAAFALLAAATAAGAAVNYKSPVAVLPFKNLNDDSASDWLKLGVAETMLTDLKKAKVDVVERDQIDKALGEILLQGQAGSDDGQAVQVGKLVGAKTVVVGSFQAAGTQLRFNARFVEVETGVILDTAKTTGPLDQVFSLQDQVVDKLLGAETAKATRPVRKKGTKTVEAYKLYAMSLATASDADRVGLLKKSLALDPSFVYAADELAALEKRLTEYASRRETANTKVDRDTLAVLADPKVPPEEKTWRVAQFLNRHLNERKCRQVVREADTILEMNIPDPPSGLSGANEFALYSLFECHRRLEQDDLAIQAGEKLLARYPSGTWYQSVENGIKEIIAWRKAAPERTAKVDARLAELDAALAKSTAERAARIARIAELDGLLSDPATPDKHHLEVEKDAAETWQRRIESEIFANQFERCWFPLTLDAARALDGCRAFVSAYRTSTLPWQRPNIVQAESYVIKLQGELGQWSEAVPAARAFAAAHPEPEFSSMVGDVKSLLDSTWPTDAAP